MSNYFEFKGYLGSAEVDSENNVLHGRLLFIQDAVGYSAATVPELKNAFEAAVDDYLSACAEEGDEPDIPCKGSFNVRVGPERHRSANLAARRKGTALNDFVCNAIDEALKSRTIVHRHEVWVTVGQEFTSLTTGDAIWKPIHDHTTAKH